MTFDYGAETPPSELVTGRQATSARDSGLLADAARTLIAVR